MRTIFRTYFDIIACPEHILRRGRQFLFVAAKDARHEHILLGIKNPLFFYPFLPSLPQQDQKKADNFHKNQGFSNFGIISCVFVPSASLCQTAQLYLSIFVSFDGIVHHKFKITAINVRFLRVRTESAIFCNPRFAIILLLNAAHGMMHRSKTLFIGGQKQ